MRSLCSRAVPTCSRPKPVPDLQLGVAPVRPWKHWPVHRMPFRFLLESSRWHLLSLQRWPLRPCADLGIMQLMPGGHLLVRRRCRVLQVRCWLLFEPGMGVELRGVRGGPVPCRDRRDVVPPVRSVCCRHQLGSAIGRVHALFCGLLRKESRVQCVLKLRHGNVLGFWSLGLHKLCSRHVSVHDRGFKLHAVCRWDLFELPVWSSQLHDVFRRSLPSRHGRNELHLLSRRIFPTPVFRIFEHRLPRLPGRQVLRSGCSRMLELLPRHLRPPFRGRDELHELPCGYLQRRDGVLELRPVCARFLPEQHWRFRLPPMPTGDVLPGGSYEQRS